MNGIYKDYLQYSFLKSFSTLYKTSSSNDDIRDLVFYMELYSYNKMGVRKKEIGDIGTYLL